MTLAAISLSILFTATLSGTFGLGGGMLLMGIYAFFFTVPQAMVLHGVTQLSSNVSRVLALRRHVYRPVLAPFATGILTSLFVCAFIRVSLDKTALYFALGGLPLLAATSTRFIRVGFPLDVHQTWHAFAAASLIATLSLLMGTSGPILDLLFARSKLDRFSVVGTKAVLAVMVHTAKVAYWTSIATEADLSTVSPSLLLAAVLLPPFGTLLGKSLLTRLREVRFRRYSQALIIAIGCVYLVRALNLALFS